MKKEISYSVFTTTWSGIQYPVKNHFASEGSANLWVYNNSNAQRRDPIYTPEGILTFLKYPNGLFVKKIEGMIELRTVVSDKGKHRKEYIFPFETKAQAIIRINHSSHVMPYDIGQVVEMY